MCYLTIWNSPADVTGTVTVDDGGKKDNKGTFFISTFKVHCFVSEYLTQLCLSCVGSCMCIVRCD